MAYTSNGNQVSHNGEFLCYIGTDFAYLDSFTTGSSGASGITLASTLAAALNAQEAPAKPREQVPLYVALASAYEALKRYRDQGAIAADWAQKHRNAIRRMCGEHLPSGSGWDNGTRFAPEASKPDHMVFSGSWHHMNENGFYDGWTDHNVIVRPSLSQGFYIRITGRNRNDIKEQLHEMFDAALRAPVDRWCGYERSEGKEV